MEDLMTMSKFATKKDYLKAFYVRKLTKENPEESAEDISDMADDEVDEHLAKEAEAHQCHMEMYPGNDSPSLTPLGSYES